MQVGARAPQVHTKEVSAAPNTHFTICLTPPLLWKCFQSGLAYLAERGLCRSLTMFSLIMECICFGLGMKKYHSGADSPLIPPHSCFTLTRKRTLMQFIKQNYGIFLLTHKEKHRNSTTSMVFLDSYWCSHLGAQLHNLMS